MVFPVLGKPEQEKPAQLNTNVSRKRRCGSLTLLSLTHPCGCFPNYTAVTDENVHKPLRRNGLREIVVLHTYRTSPQASYRLRRLFSKVAVCSFCCRFFPTATRVAGLAVGAALRVAVIPQTRIVVSHTYPKRKNRLWRFFLFSFALVTCFVICQ